MSITETFVSCGLSPADHDNTHGVASLLAGCRAGGGHDQAIDPNTGAGNAANLSEYGPCPDESGCR